MNNDNVTQLPGTQNAEAEALKELETYCESVAMYNEILFQKLLRKGFTNEQAFKLLVLSQSE